MFTSFPSLPNRGRKISTLFILPVLLSPLIFSFSNAQEASTSDSYYHFSLAQLHQVREEYSLSSQEYQKALEADPTSAELRTKYAEMLFRKGDIALAVEQCEEAIRVDPSDPEPHFLLGDIYSKMGEQSGMAERALEEFEKAIELDPEHYHAQRAVAFLYRDQRNWGKAAAAFEKLRALSPSDIGAYYWGAQALIFLGEIDEAIQVLEDGPEEKLRIPDYLLMLGGLYERTGRPDKAVDLYTQGLSRERDWRLLQNLAQALLDSGRSEEAIPLFEELVRQHPDRTEFKVLLAQALRQQNRIEEAVDLLAITLEAEPDHVKAAFELSRAWSSLGEREKAIAQLEKLIALDSVEAKRYRNVFKMDLGLLYEETDRRDKGLEMLESVVADSPGVVEPRLRLLYAYRGAKRPQAALELSDELIAEHPDDPFVIVARGMVLADNDRLEEGIDLITEKIESGVEPEFLYVGASQILLSHEAFDRAERVIEEGLETLPASEKLRFQLGAIYERQDRHDQAEDVFKEILEDNPDHSDVLNYLGYMLADRGVRLEEALNYLLRAVELDPYNGAYLDSLGWVHYKKENLDEAEVYLTKAAAISNSDPVILEHLGDLYMKMQEVSKARHYYELSLTHAENQEESERVKKKLTGLSASREN